MDKQVVSGQLGVQLLWTKELIADDCRYESKDPAPMY